MKKSEFKKMLKKEKHHLTQGKIYEILFTIIFILTCAILVFLEYKDILPSARGVILSFILIIIGIPYWNYDVKRDKAIKEMYEHYQKENKILEVKDNSKTIRTILIIETICTLLIVSYVAMNYMFKDDFVPNNQEEIVNISTKNGEIIETEIYEFDNGNFSLKIPKEFHAMDQEMINLKYPNGNPPEFVLTNDRTTVNVVVNATKNPLKNSQIKSYINLMEEQLSGSVNNIETHFFERDGHEIGEISFVSTAVDTDIYNHMMVFSDNGFERVVSFNCTKELQEGWQDVGKFIINSLKFK